MKKIEKRRPIRSFVRREGRITPAQRYALDSLWEKYGIDYVDQVLNFSEIFNREAGLVLEIGFGNGESLLQMAVEAPELNFIGIEVHSPGVGNLLLGIEREACQNTRIISHDAVNVLEQMVGDACLDRVQIFFPDPWPKKRHHKRRLIQAGFVSLLHKKLKPNGVLHLATDWENYAQHMMEVLSASEGFRNRVSNGGFYADASSLRPVTKFEQRGLRLGHKIFDLIFEKV